MKPCIANTTKEIASAFKLRMNELGTNSYKIFCKYPNIVSYPTLRRLLTGDKAITLSSMLIYAELLDLDIIIQPKKHSTDENKD